MKLINWSLLSYFLLPYFIFLFFFKPVVSLNFSEIRWALGNSFIQSSVAATLSLIIGFGLACGVHTLPRKIKPLFLNLLLVPQVLPVLFSILIVLAKISPFPMGTIGVIVIFTVINTGLAGSIIYHALQRALNQYGMVSDVYGLSNKRFLLKVLLPSIFADLRQAFLVIFLFCFTSISVPLVAGGGKGTNLEVLIYEKIFIDQDWSVAWALNLLQTILVALLSYVISSPSRTNKVEFYYSSRLKSKLMVGGLAAYLLLYMGGYMQSVYSSWSEFDFLILYKAELIEAFRNSIVLYILTSLFFAIFSLSWIFYFTKTLHHLRTRHIFSISTVLVGFVLYLLFPVSIYFDYIKIPLAFSFLVFVIIFRSFYMTTLDSIKQQLLVAQVYGVNFWNIFINVIWPLTKKNILICFSILFVWQISDFAILKSLGTQIQTLGLISENFMSSYRMNAAILVSFFILVIWFIFNFLLLAIMKGCNVDRQKHSS